MLKLSLKSLFFSKWPLLWKIRIAETGIFFFSLLFLLFLFKDFSMVFPLLCCMLATAAFVSCAVLKAERRKADRESFADTLSAKISGLLTMKDNLQNDYTKKFLKLIKKELDAGNEQNKAVLSEMRANQQDSFKNVEKSIKELSDVYALFKDAIESQTKQNTALVNDMTALHKSDIKILEELLRD